MSAVPGLGGFHAGRTIARGSRLHALISHLIEVDERIGILRHIEVGLNQMLAFEVDALEDGCGLVEVGIAAVGYLAH